MDNLVCGAPSAVFEGRFLQAYYGLKTFHEPSWNARNITPPLRK
jgi:hypothetical protein